MSQHSDLAPWAHPKAQQWYSQLLNKSGLIDHVFQFNEIPDSQLDVAQVRLMNGILMLLARPGVWPERDAFILKTTAEKISRFLEKASRAEPGNQPLSIKEHQQRQQEQQALKAEMAVLNGRLALSKSQKPGRQPIAWKRFWN